MTRSATLITGGTGFIGGELARALAIDGVPPHLLARRGYAPSRIPPSASVVEDPLVTTELRPLLVPLGIDTCFHLASKFVAAHRHEDVEELVASNVALGARVAESLAGQDPPVTFVNVGTAWQHAGGAGYAPTSLYAATKQAFQDLLTYYADHGLLRVINVKLFDTYGERDRRPKLVNLLLGAAAEGVHLDMSPGEQLIDLLHVDDVVGGLRHVAGHVPPGSYALSSREPRSIKELAALVADVTGRNLDITFGARPYRSVEMFDEWFAGDVPEGWVPAVPLRDGLARVWGDRIG